MNRRRAIKACSGMLKSNAFATSHYSSYCEESAESERKLGDEADHIIDLELVSECFCEAFWDNSLGECLEVRK